MSADDQTFLDTLNAVGVDVKRYSDEAMNLLEQSVDKAATVVREALSSQRWVPESVRPKAPPSKPVTKLVPQTLYKRTSDWVFDHKILTGIFVLGITTASVGLISSNRRNYSKKRRAKRVSNGARLEVVVLVGSPSEPVVRSLALDLERRGFIVFIICNDVEEEVMVQNESRPDIRPLAVDVSRPEHAVKRFSDFLSTPQHAFDGARAHALTLSALILIPSITYPSAPLATLSASAISDIVNTRIAHPMLLTQAFLPLLASLPFTHSHHQSSITISNPKVLVLTPSIIPSLNPPFHIPEATSAAALSAFTQSLQAELSPLDIPVYHLKLGTFDLSPLQSKAQQGQNWQAHQAETLRWPQGAREAYGSNYLKMMERNAGTGRRGGSPLRELHNAVFDAMETRKPSWWTFGVQLADHGGIIRVGQGSGTYAFVGAWIPRSLVSWMMGIRTVQRTEVIETEVYGKEEDMHRSLARIDGSEYVSVFPTDESDIL